MPGVLASCISSPLQFVNNTFENLFVKEKKSLNHVIEHVLNSAKLELKGKREFMVQQIPLLTAATANVIANGSLVRYRCMLCDSLGPELFNGVLSIRDKPGREQLRTSLWRDHIEITEEYEFCENESLNFLDRQIYVGSPIPGETTWVLERQNAEESAPIMPKRQCLIKLYRDADKLKINQIYEFYGVYFNESAPEKTEESSAQMSDTSDQQKSAENLFSLHILQVEPLLHAHPTLLNDPDELTSQLSALSNKVANLRSRLIDILTKKLFFGDSLVSEYLICHLLSSVFVVNDTVAVGNFPINIFNIPTSFDWIASLKSFFNTVLTNVAYLPLSLETLNGECLFPKKCYETDKLIHSRLQLGNGAQLVLDETKMQPGQLSAQGLNNVSALESIIHRQVLHYDFQHDTFEFPTNIRVLILSEGVSFLRCDTSIPLENIPSDSTSDQSCFDLSDQTFIEDLREYFALIPALPYVSHEDIEKLIQADYVQMRKQDHTVTSEDLHRLLTIARLLSISMGEKELRHETWDKAKHMEAERKRRLKK